MIKVSIKNVPANVAYWVASIVLPDGTEVVSEDKIPVGASWATGLAAGVVSNIRFIVYTKDQVYIGYKELNGTTLVDGKEYSLDWGAGKFEEISGGGMGGLNTWTIVALVALALLMLNRR